MDPDAISSHSPFAHQASPTGEGLLQRNIRALVEHRAEQRARSSLEERLADRITVFAGSMRFVYLHFAIFGFWIVANLGWIPGVAAWDPSMVVLAMIASVEAIFLSTFVLISQNRMAAADDERADLNLQISLLTEHEMTRAIAMLSAIAERIGARSGVEDEVEELKREVAPEHVLSEIEGAKQAERRGAGRQ